MGDREVVELTVERGAGNDLANGAVLALSVVGLAVVAGTRPASRYAGERVVVLTDGDRTLRVPDRVLDASLEVRAVVGRLRPPGCSTSAEVAGLTRPDRSVYGRPYADRPVYSFSGRPT